jgi:glycosyltransferase involved in cell wall biosynthesis
MARQKIVIASSNPGAKDIIIDNKTGFIFPIGNHKDLAKKINYALSKDHKTIRLAARKSVEKYSWLKIIKDLDNLIS